MKKLIITTSIGFLALTCFVGYHLAMKGWEKAENLVNRLQKLEESAAKIGHHIGNTLEVYQAGLTSAKFKPQSTENPLLSDGSWELFGGQGVNSSWEKGKFKRARTFLKYKGDIYVGLDGGKEGLASVWRYSEKGWEKIGGSGIFESWTDSTEVVSLHKYEEKLYAGLISPNHGATVWRFDGSQWQLIGGGTANSWVRRYYKAALSMEVYEGKLWVALSVAGLGQGNNLPPSVYSFDGSQWQLSIASDAWPEDYQGIYELFAHSDGYLYLGLGGNGANSQGDVWRYRSGSLEQIGGDGIRGSWINPSMDWALRFADYQNNLIVVQNRNPSVKGRFTTVWSFDGVEWQPIANNCPSSRLQKLSNLNAIEVYKGHLLLGAGAYPAGQSSIWELKPNNCWGLVAGFGVNGSWGTSNGMGYLTSRSSREYVYRMSTIDGDLYVGFGASRGNGQVWKWTNKK